MTEAPIEQGPITKTRVSTRARTNPRPKAAAAAGPPTDTAAVREEADPEPMPFKMTVNHAGAEVEIKFNQKIKGFRLNLAEAVTFGNAVLTHAERVRVTNP